MISACDFARPDPGDPYAGKRVQDGMGLKGESWTLLLSELAYQSGKNFISLKSYQAFLLEAQNKSIESTVQAFKQTKAWEVSGADRRKHYTDLITKAMKG